MKIKKRSQTKIDCSVSPGTGWDASVGYAKYVNTLGKQTQGSSNTLPPHRYWIY